MAEVKTGGYPFHTSGNAPTGMLGAYPRPTRRPKTIVQILNGEGKKKEGEKK